MRNEARDEGGRRAGGRDRRTDGWKNLGEEWGEVKKRE